MGFRSNRQIVPLVTALAGALVPSVMVLAADAETWGTPTQATRGHQFFNNQCAQCHRPDLMGAAGPALIGQTFQGKWGGKPLSDLYTFEHQNMPALNPGSVPPDQLWAITAYILQKNGFAMGSSELGDAAGTQVLKK